MVTRIIHLKDHALHAEKSVMLIYGNQYFNNQFHSKLDKVHFLLPQQTKQSKV